MPWFDAATLLHWRTVEDWLAEHLDETEIRAQHEAARRSYLEHRRELLGSAIFVGRKVYVAMASP